MFQGVPEVRTRSSDCCPTFRVSPKTWTAIRIRNGVCCRIRPLRMKNGNTAVSHAVSTGSTLDPADCSSLWVTWSDRAAGKALDCPPIIGFSAGRWSTIRKSAMIRRMITTWPSTSRCLSFLSSSPCFPMFWAKQQVIRQLFPELLHISADRCQ